jgi:hypothetical protein
MNDKKIKFISGGNWGNSYYTDYNGKLYSGSTGSVYIIDFIKRLKLDIEFLEYHPDLVYHRNGVSCNTQGLFPCRFEYFDEIPIWTYSKDNDKPFISQLNIKELEEFNKYNYSGIYDSSMYRR